jgi:hypothetical protein
MTTARVPAEPMCAGRLGQGIVLAVINVLDRAADLAVVEMALVTAPGRAGVDLLVLIDDVVEYGLAEKAEGDLPPSISWVSRLLPRRMRSHSRCMSPARRIAFPSD